MSHTYQTRVAIGPPLTPVVKTLLILNIAVYLGQTLDRSLHYYWLDLWMSLIPVTVTLGGQIWRLVTYMFLHGPQLLHIVFNMLILWMFGPEIEGILGRRRFVAFYLITGVGAGLCSLAVSPFSTAAIVGASGAMYAILLAYAMYFPDRYLLVFFVLPVKAKYLVVATIVLELMFSLSGVQDGIAHVAHLGGMAFGYLLLRYRTLLPDLKYRWLRLRGWWYRRKFKVYRNDPPRRGGPWGPH
ncbi:MAG TPA: rhomboid family intramembrane serine protease [Acidobacteriota bacterium]|nr:rhomboid family intramembrane serine protease [Acidobacteriota bacterium]